MNDEDINELENVKEHRCVNSEEYANDVHVNTENRHGLRA